MNKTVRIVQGVILAVLWAAPAFCLSFSIDPATQSIATGELALFELNVSDLGTFRSPSLGAFSVIIEYDETFLEFQTSSVVFSDYLSPSGQVVNLQSPGIVYMAESSVGTPDALNSLQPNTFAVVGFSFRGLRAIDTVSLSLDPVVSGDEYGENRAEFDLIAEVKVTAPIPEPATLILVASGLGGMALFRRKKLRSRR